MKYIKILLITLYPVFVFSQFGNQDDIPLSIVEPFDYTNIKNINLKLPTLKSTEEEMYWVAADAHDIDIDFSDFQLHKVYGNGAKLYVLKITSATSEGVMLTFDNIELSKGSKLWVLNTSSQQYVGAYTQRDIDDQHQLISSLVEGDEFIIEVLVAPKVELQNFHLSKVYNFLKRNSPVNSQSVFCMADADCNQIQSYDPANYATCKIVMINNHQVGYCTGTLINNSKNDGTPYILTANHCAGKTEYTQFEKWEFHFNNFVECDNKNINKSLVIKGSDLMTRSSPYYDGEYTDFMLLKLRNKLPKESNLVFLGWDRAESISSSGSSFHHPSGSFKKHSQYQEAPKFSNISSKINVPSHIVVQWGEIGDKISVTHKGSSGCALVNDQGLIVGTLTGGSSSCNDVNGRDYFGRFAIHWDNNDSQIESTLSKFLDPDQEGIMSLNSLKISDINYNTNSIATTSIIDEDISITYRKTAIDVNAKAKGMNIIIYNLLGKKLSASLTDDNNKSIDISELPRGIYIIHVTQNNKTKTEKFQV